MSIKIVFKDAKTFARILSYNAEFDKTISTVVLRPDGFHMQTMDASHTSINELKLPPEYFEIYEVHTEEIQIGLPLEIVYDFIKNVKHETLTLMKTDTSPNIQLSVVSDDGFEACLSVKSINQDSELFQIPPMPPNCIFNVDLLTLKKWSSFLPKKGAIKFVPEKKTIRVESTTDSGSFKLCEQVEYEHFKKPNHVQVGSVVMDKIYKLMHFGFPIAFKLVNDAPLQCSVDLGSNVKMFSYFAPMIEDEMELE